MAAILSTAEARSILGDDVLGLEEVAATFGASATSGALPPIPFSEQELRAARANGEILILRAERDSLESPLTIQNMIVRYGEAFDARFLRKMGYQLKDEWGIELEPVAAVDTCSAGWALVRREPIESSRNLSYDEQEPRIGAYAQHIGLSAAALRRRTAVEVVYDTLLYFASRKVRLLAKAWDWSSTRTIDGGYLNVGGFGPSGMQVLSYSRAVRHGALGICPTRQPSK